jgi:hypothetical protein
VLACAPSGRTAQELATDLFGDQGRTIAVRAEMSRLRRHVAGVLDTAHTGSATGSRSWSCALTMTPTCCHGRGRRPSSAAGSKPHMTCLTGELDQLPGGFTTWSPCGHSLIGTVYRPRAFSAASCPPAPRSTA